MRKPVRYVAVVAVLAAAGAVVLFLGRATTAQAPPYKAPRTADGKPDLNGIWQALNTANWDLEAHAARAAQAVVVGSPEVGLLPTDEIPAAPVLALGARGGVPGGLGVVEGEEIPYQPWAAAKKRENAEHSLTRDPEVKCFLPGVPRATYMPYPFQIVHSTNKIMMAYEFAAATRTVHMDKVPPAQIDTWMGHSVGRWEGETLVVDVTGLREDTWFDRAGNFHSDALRVTERYTPVSPAHLEYEATIEDPKVFTRPWRIKMPLYRRVERNAELSEYKCPEFVEELMYGHLRKKQLVKQWKADLGERGGMLIIDVTRKVTE